MGKIYTPSVVGTHCSLGFGKLYPSKPPMTAVDVLYDRVLPFYEQHQVEIQHLLTDNVLPSVASTFARAQKAQGSPGWPAAS
jgi:hypothetical protein